MATALRPICTTVKKVPGFSCIFRMRCALMLPSSASNLSLIFLDAASEISDNEKNALTAMRQSMTKILFNIIYPAIDRILGRVFEYPCGKHNESRPEAVDRQFRELV
ncbi:CBS/transporter associated domain protein [Enterobacter sp. FY-07]|nr:CBS/transporter associated domain protein [Enterobacter sp. FY-07]